MSFLVKKKKKLAITHTIVIKLKENVTMWLVCETPIIKHFFLKIGIFLFSNLRKKHLNPIWTWAEFQIWPLENRPLRAQKNP